MNIEYSKDLLSGTRVAATWTLDTSRLKKGIDNYHTDVRISPRFTASLKKIVSSLVAEATSPERSKSAREAHNFEPIRSDYLDMMTLLIHRIKTDLSLEEIQILEFALIKHVLEVVRGQLDELISSVKARASELRDRGSTESLGVNQRLVWLQRNYDAALLSVNRQIFTHLQRVDSRHLRSLREQYLGAPEHDAMDVLDSAMLLTADLAGAAFLTEQYRLWASGDMESEDSGFGSLNSELEELLAQALPEFHMLPLRTAPVEADPELYDALGGLLQTQKFMGIAANQKSRVEEQFCWFDDPANIRELFGVDRYPMLLQHARSSSGLSAWWRLRKQSRRMVRILDRISGRLARRGLFKPLIASQQVSKVWNAALAERFDPRLLCQFFGGQIPLRKLIDQAGKKALPDTLLEKIEQGCEEVKKQASGHGRRNTALILEDISRYRLHLKYYRFAHRCFNRLKILKHPDDIALSREAGTLYTLFTATEREDVDVRMVRHCIMKADVRGSLKVTQELLSRGLNPASYFSTRFFSPINRILDSFSAQKVFIEGDAIILSFPEYEQEPQQWFSVARACGLAREMLRLVHINNRYSRQMDLPPLELGIGICHSDEPPRFLFDEDKPIMISSAIGQADRLSSCSWKLREHLDPAPFNVAVYRLAYAEQDPDEKGQQVIRYNVNGILLEEAAFEKLGKEIQLRQTSLDINGEAVIFHVGRYPDKLGQVRDLVVRQARIELWSGEAALADARSQRSFYEVISDRRIISQALEKSRQVARVN